MNDISISGIDSATDVGALAQILAWAFGFSPADAAAWLTQSGLENVRAARRGAQVVGGLLEIPMGQWFGGRSVPMRGLAGVAVTPAARGSGVAVGLVREALACARAEGVALSALYPASLTLYRQAGYELAGSYFRWSGRLTSLPRAPLSSELVPVDAKLESSIDELYRRVASTRSGYLDRGRYVWQRVRSNKDEPTLGYAVLGRAGELEGYVYLSQRVAQGRERELVIHDLIAETPAAAARLITLLADHRSTLSGFVWNGTATDSVLFALPERVVKIELVEHWMLRIVDVAGALSRRGYPAVNAEVDLQVTDSALPDNAGRYRLLVSDGVASVEPGGRGSVRLDVRTLAALYSGFVAPSELVRAGLLEATPTSTALLAMLFAGTVPAMTDYF